MQFDGLPDQSQGPIACVGRRNASRKVGNIGAKRRWPFFNNNEIAHLHLLLLEARLLQDTVKSARRHIGSGIARNSNGTRFFRRMVKLAMTPCDAYLNPSVRLNQGNEFTNLHRQSLPSSLRRRALRARWRRFALQAHFVRMPFATRPEGPRLRAPRRAPTSSERASLPAPQRPAPKASTADQHPPTDAVTIPACAPARAAAPPAWPCDSCP